MKKNDMITIIQNNELKLWNNLQALVNLEENPTDRTKSLINMARSSWSSVYDLMVSLGINPLH